MTPREFLESQSTLTDAKAVLQKMIRRAARRRIYDFAHNNHIFDFNDVTTEGWQKTFKDNVLSVATGYSTSVSAANNQTELANIFNEIEQYL